MKDSEATQTSQVRERELCIEEANRAPVVKAAPSLPFVIVEAAGQSLSVERGTGALVRTAGGASASITVHG